MADLENAGTTPSADTASASPSANGQSADVDVLGSESQPTTAPEPTTDALNPSIEADPWATFGTDEQAEDTEAPAEPTTETDKPAAKKEDEKSLEDQVLEEAFGDNPPPVDPAKPDESDEEPTEDELKGMTPEEAVERQRNASARQWAKRNAERAQIVKDFAFGDRPITEIAGEFQQLNPDRYVQLQQTAAYELIDSNPEATIQRALLVAALSRNPYLDPSTVALPTLDDAIAKLLAPAGSPAATADAPAKTSDQPSGATTLPAELQAEIDALDDALGFDWRDPANDAEFLDNRELGLARTVRQMEAVLKAQAATQEKPEDKPVEPGQFTAAEQETLRPILDKAVADYRSSVEDRVLPYIRKNTGLEISSEDTPEIKEFKENLMVLYTGTEYDRKNGFASEFETFATQESSVAQTLTEVYGRVTDAKLNAAAARLRNNEKAAQEFEKAAEDERPNVIAALAQANREFKAKRIDPFMRIVGTSTLSQTKEILQQAARTEIVSNGGEAPAYTPKQREAATADDVWNNVVEEAGEEDRMRAA